MLFYLLTAYIYSVTTFRVPLPRPPDYTPLTGEEVMIGIVALGAYLIYGWVMEFYLIEKIKQNIDTQKNTYYKTVMRLIIKFKTLIYYLPIIILVLVIIYDALDVPRLYYRYFAF